MMPYDYTKFHIGVYLTLTSIYMTVVSIKIADTSGYTHPLLPANEYLMAVAVICFVLAGVAVGNNRRQPNSTGRRKQQ